MLTCGLLEKIGFTEEQICKYNELDKLYGEEIEAFSQAFMVKKTEFKEVVDKLHTDFNVRLHEYTANLLFVNH